MPPTIRSGIARPPPSLALGLLSPGWKGRETGTSCTRGGTRRTGHVDLEEETCPDGSDVEAARAPRVRRLGPDLRRAVDRRARRDLRRSGGGRAEVGRSE